MCSEYGGNGYLRVPKKFGYDVTPCQCLFFYEHYVEVYSLILQSRTPLTKLLQNPFNSRVVHEGEISNQLIKILVGREDIENRKKPWVYISGSTGTGKTFLATAFAQAALEDEINTLFVSWPVLLSAMRPNSTDTNLTIERAATVDFLVLDDFGQEKASEWSAQQLYTIINERYEKLLPTVFVSNVPLKEIAATMGSATQSRISGLSIQLVLVGEDKRQK